MKQLDEAEHSLDPSTECFSWTANDGSVFAGVWARSVASDQLKDLPLRLCAVANCSAEREPDGLRVLCKDEDPQLIFEFNHTTSGPAVFWCEILDKTFELQNLSLYLDFGDGYSERYRSALVASGNRWSTELMDTEGLRYVRLDPGDGMCDIVLAKAGLTGLGESLEAVTLVSSDLVVQSLDGFEWDQKTGLAIATHHDPRILFEVVTQELAPPCHLVMLEMKGQFGRELGSPPKLFLGEHEEFALNFNTNADNMYSLILVCPDLLEMIRVDPVDERIAFRLHDVRLRGCLETLPA